MKTLIAVLLTGCAAAYAAAFDPISSINYVDGVDLIHLESDEETMTEWEIGRTFVRYDMHDLTVRGDWDPDGGVNTWQIQSGEWQITLELSSVNLIDGGPFQVEETYYGFDLTLSNDSWSHTLENIGMWWMKEGSLQGFGGTVLSDGYLSVGSFGYSWSEPGERRTYNKQNSPLLYTWADGESFDTGMVEAGWQIDNTASATTWYDIPIGDEYWVLAMNLTQHEGDIFARFGLGEEVSRDLVFAHVPEPGVWAMMVIGLIGLVAFGRKGGGA